MMVKLIRVEGEEYVLDRLPVVLGRCEDATIGLHDRWTSRRHCQIEQCSIDRSRSVLLVRDLGSTHGTYVNGEQVREAYLHSGDHLSVGLATFRVELDDAFCPAGEIGEYSAA